MSLKRQKKAHDIRTDIIRFAVLIATRLLFFTTFFGKKSIDFFLCKEKKTHQPNSVRIVGRALMPEIREMNTTIIPMTRRIVGCL